MNTNVRDAEARRVTGADPILCRVLAENGIKAPALDMRGRTAPSDETAPCRYKENANYGVRGRALGIAYSPIQEWTRLYDPEKGLSRGTLFEELDLPFTAYLNEGGRYGG